MKTLNDNARLLVGGKVLVLLTEVLSRDDSSGNQTVSFGQERRLQTIGDKAGRFLLDVDCFAVEAGVEL